MDFEMGYSLANAAIVLDALDGKCECQPYKDVFTFPGWKEQGFHVKRGEKSCAHITVYKTFEVEDDDGKKRKKTFPKVSHLFCRCQVEENKPKGGVQ